MASSRGSDPDPLAATVERDDPSATLPSSGGGGTAAPLPERLGRYRLVRKLGEGGMGIVHLAHDDELDRPVAIKILRPEGDGDPRRLLREARSMARLSHPHIAAVYDVGTHGDDVYVAMEYVQGPTLRQWSEQPHTWAERAEVLLQAARGLAAAHAAGVVHRDFKPDNVIIGRDGRVRVLDFGLAKLAPGTAGHSVATPQTVMGSIVGTPRYMAPEQLRTKPAGPPADQFAFCLTAYEVAYRQRAFEGEVFADVAVSVLTTEPASPPSTTDAPEALWAVLRQGLRLDTAERHPSMAALAEALERVIGAEAAAPVVVSRPALRDAREDARQRLTEAYAEDLLDADEIDERLEQLENAADPEAVEELVADLRSRPPAVAPPVAALAVPEAKAPAAGDRNLPAVPGRNLPAVIEAPAHKRMITIFSGTRRGGAWVPARVNQVITLFGGSDIDLREANLPPGEIELRVFAMFGGVDIIVPPGVTVRMECTALFGGADHEDAIEPPDPDATVVRVTGWVLFGGVGVVERLPGESGWAARRRRKKRRKELAAAKARALTDGSKPKALPPER